MLNSFFYTYENIPKEVLTLMYILHISIYLSIWIHELDVHVSTMNNLCLKSYTNQINFSTFLCLYCMFEIKTFVI